MNRWRLSQFREVFDEGARSRRMEVCARNTWSGPEQKEHLSHPNLARALALGFTLEELLQRGLMFLIRKTATR
jgi:hypothetical protein